MLSWSLRDGSSAVGTFVPVGEREPTVKPVELIVGFDARFEVGVEAGGVGGCCVEASCVATVDTEAVSVLEKVVLLRIQA